MQTGWRFDHALIRFTCLISPTMLHIPNTGAETHSTSHLHDQVCIDANMQYRINFGVASTSLYMSTVHPCAIQTRNQQDLFKFKASKRYCGKIHEGGWPCGCYFGCKECCSSLRNFQVVPYVEKLYETKLQQLLLLGITSAIAITKGANMTTKLLQSTERRKEVIVPYGTLFSTTRWHWVYARYSNAI